MAANRQLSLTPGLDARVLQLIWSSSWELDDASFEDVALDLFDYAFETCEPYGRYCRSLGSEPGNVSCWREIPPVPTSAFKEAVITTCPPETWAYTFVTSGTTSRGEQPGVVHRDASSQRLVQAAQVRLHQEYVLPDRDDILFLSLVPSPEMLPKASIAHSVELLMAHHGTSGSRSFFDSDGLDVDGLLERLRNAAAANVDVELYGATYSFVHLLDQLRDRAIRVQLPPGSRVVHGSGYKGRSRELTEDGFVNLVADCLGVPPMRNVDVLGMSELGSQFYDNVIRRSHRLEERARCKEVAPWTRTRVVEPETLTDQAPGEVGLLLHYDLSLRGNVPAILTEDLGVTVDGGFRILGRADSAIMRGCNLVMEALLAASG